jgi:hypothetical protein
MPMWPLDTATPVCSAGCSDRLQRGIVPSSMAESEQRGPDADLPSFGTGCGGMQLAKEPLGPQPDHLSTWALLGLFATSTTLNNNTLGFHIAWENTALIRIEVSLKRTHTQHSRLRWDAARRLGLRKRIASLRKDLVKVVLEPSDVWVQSRKLPLAIDLLVPVHVEAVRVALDRHLGHGGVGVSLVRHAQLVVPDHLVL